MGELPSGNSQTEPSKVRQIIKARISLPESFDARFNGLNFDATVIACTTMPLPKLLNDLNGRSLDKEHWVQTFPTETIWEGKFLFKKPRTIYQVDPLEMITSNRYYYGWQSGISDVLFNEYPIAAERIFKGDYSAILYLGKHYPKFAPITDEETLYNLIEYSNTHANFKVQSVKVKAATKLLVDSLASISNVDSALMMASRRQGVQVVYGGEGLDAHLNRFGRRAGDVFAAKVLSERIPTEFITAILPVGQYEQEKLLGMVA